MNSFIDIVIHASRVIVFAAVAAVLAGIDFTVGMPLLSMVGTVLIYQSLHFEIQRLSLLLMVVVIVASIFSFPFWLTALVLGGYVLVDDLYTQPGNRARWRVVGLIIGLMIFYLFRSYPFTLVHWVYLGVVGGGLIWRLYKRPQGEVYG